jgi:hypothetical protein
LSQNARKCFEFFSKHEKDFSKSGIIDSKYFELIKNLIKSIPSSLSSATEFEPEPIGGENSLKNLFKQIRSKLKEKVDALLNPLKYR